MTISKKLHKLGIILPKAAKPVASYVPCISSGGFAYISGQLPFIDGSLPATGKVGSEIDKDTAKNLARISALNILAAADADVGLDNIDSLIKLTGFVASSCDFYEQPYVINGASDLFYDIFDSYHARSAVSVPCLPLNAPVELEAIFKLKHI